jgi:hypothetical protein
MVRVTHVSGWAYALGGLGLAGVGAFAYLGGTGLDEKNQLRASCGNTCTDAQVAPLKARYIGADISLGVGVVAALAAAWLFVHPRVEEVPATALAPAISVGARGATLGVGGAF